MINVNQAWDIVKKNNPGMKPSGCIEYKDYYSFAVVPSDLESGDCYCDSTSRVVYKETGEYRTIHYAYHDMTKYVRSIDVEEFN